MITVDTHSVESQLKMLVAEKEKKRRPGHSLRVRAKDSADLRGCAIRSALNGTPQAGPVKWYL